MHLWIICHRSSKMNSQTYQSPDFVTKIQKKKLNRPTDLLIKRNGGGRMRKSLATLLKQALFSLGFADLNHVVLSSPPSPFSVNHRLVPVLPYWHRPARSHRRRWSSLHLWSRFATRWFRRFVPQKSNFHKSNERGPRCNAMKTNFNFLGLNRIF